MFKQLLYDNTAPWAAAVISCSEHEQTNDFPPYLFLHTSAACLWML